MNFVLCLNCGQRQQIQIRIHVKGPSPRYHDDNKIQITASLSFLYNKESINTHISTIISKFKVQTDLQKDKLTDCQNDRQNSNNMSV